MYFYKVLLSNSSADQQNIKLYCEEASLVGINVKIPNINISSQNAEIFFDEIYLPFNLIKGIGQAVVEKILNERNRAGPFNNFVATWLRLRIAGIGESTIETLIKAGTFSDFANQKTLLSSIDICLDYYELFKIKSKKTENLFALLDDFIIKNNLDELKLIAKEQDNATLDQYEIDFLGTRYTNENWTNQSLELQNDAILNLANLSNNYEWLKVSLLEVKKGTKFNHHTILKLKDDSKIVVASSWSFSVEKLLLNQSSRDIMVYIMRKDHKYYNVKDFKELLDE
ncbi:hypothetical protein [Mycoplasmopsis cynos]|uniref:helix-hairpin-helix domain-containing protein n=1 Tax=Mycoplasmopsis cynos TaxID=171284 RepID=UPI0022041332|nr:hypothetical protein [Mycoplasmopsis cynos]UWV92207.1 hypothetical protein NWE57_04835 [Mycoplasmopsis cynos]